jgi:hypothetical protein
MDLGDKVYSLYIATSQLRDRNGFDSQMGVSWKVAHMKWELLDRHGEIRECLRRMMWRYHGLRR